MSTCDGPEKEPDFVSGLSAEEKDAFLKEWAMIREACAAERIKAIAEYGKFVPDFIEKLVDEGIIDRPEGLAVLQWLGSGIQSEKETDPIGKYGPAPLPLIRRTRHRIWWKTTWPSHPTLILSKPEGLALEATKKVWQYQIDAERV